MAWSNVLDAVPTILLQLGVKVSSSWINPPFFSSTIGRGIAYSPVHVAIPVGWPWPRWRFYLTRF